MPDTCVAFRGVMSTVGLGVAPVKLVALYPAAGALGMPR